MPDTNPPVDANVAPFKVPQPFFQRIDWCGFFVTAVIVLVVYSFTLAPEVTLDFSGVYATGARYAGVPAVPGFPLWTLYAWLFTVLLPFSNVAWRVAVSSAVAGALTCGVVAMMVSRGGAMIVEAAQLRPLRPTDERCLRVVAGCVAGAGFGFSGSFWGDAVIVETLPLAILLFSLVLCLLLRWVHAPEAKRYLFAAALAYGLTLTVNEHLAIAAPGLPFIVMFRKPSLGRDVFFVLALGLFLALFAHHLHALPLVLAAATQFDSIRHIYLIIGIVSAVISLLLILITRRLLTEWRTVSVAGLLLLLGLSLYLYIAIASMTNPPMNWGYPRTVEGFIHAISRGQYERLNPTTSLADWASQIGSIAALIASDVGPIYLAPAMLYFCFIHKIAVRDRGWMLGLAATFLCLTLFMLGILNPPRDLSALGMLKHYFTGAVLILTVWAGYGLVLFGTLVVRTVETKKPCPRADAASNP